jgi:hypothetical protein
MEGKLHLDHIRPISSFNYKSYEDIEFKKCWSLNNLQLLFACDNISKLNKWDGTPENIKFNLKYITYKELKQHIKELTYEHCNQA